jgi:hypothetical protein
MRNYHHNFDDQEQPELQWLEDSVNLLCYFTFLCVREIALVFANLVTTVVVALKKSER